MDKLQEKTYELTAIGVTTYNLRLFICFAYISLSTLYAFIVSGGVASGCTKEWYSLWFSMNIFLTMHLLYSWIIFYNRHRYFYSLIWYCYIRLRSCKFYIPLCRGSKSLFHMSRLVYLIMSYLFCLLRAWSITPTADL